MIQKFISEIENTKISVSQWIYGFIGILFVRFIFESLSSPSSTGVIPSDSYTLIHYTLFFLCLTLGTSYIVGKITKDYVSAPKVLLFGLPLLWLAPILDILISRGDGYKMLYIFATGKNIINNFFTFFGPSLTYGATIGMRIGIALSILGLGYYIWHKSKSILKGTLGVFLIYILVFIAGSFPGILYSLSNISGEVVTNIQVVQYLQETIQESTIYHNTLHDGVSSVSETRLLEMLFNKLMSQILFIVSLVFAVLLFWRMYPEKFWSVMKNVRLERVNFYTASLFAGVGFAYINRLGNAFVWIDVFGFLCLTLAWIALWMHAVHVNDIVDVDIDKISNIDRPLVKREMDNVDMKESGNIWLAIALLGSWCAGFYPFFMALVYIACSYIYSSPPLRLRRFPLVPSFLIGVASLATILAGFFFVSVGKEIQNFPILLAMGIVIMVTLAINFKDIKDIEGDRVNGIVTLPILFGDNGIKIVGVLFALSILLAPFFLHFYLLYIFSIPCAYAGYKLVTKKPYKEKPIFVLRFVFLSAVAISYLVLYSLYI